MKTAPESSIEFIVPEWPAPASVHAITTTRTRADGEDFNLADHVGDDPARVADNRRHLLSRFPSIDAVQWLQQVHGTAVVAAKDAGPVEADGCHTDQPGLACAVLTADCLPVLMCDRAGTRVAALHAGWRGLCAGVIRNGLAAFEGTQEIMAWLGPAIGRRHFEVGGEVRARFLKSFTGVAALDIEAAFLRAEHDNNQYFCDLVALARLQLHALGVVDIHGGHDCSIDDGDRFFSHRAEAPTGRNASLIWLGTH